jgi:hypothetical protein
MKKIILLTCFALSLLSNKINAQFTTVDSSFLYSTGEGLTINLGKAEGTKINILTTAQSGLQFNQIDSANSKINSNRLSLNLVRVSLNASTYKNKVTVGIVTDFTGTSPILEGWIGYALSKRAKLIFGQRQTHTNNRLAMADERFAQVMGQTVAGKANDGIVYGGLMQNLVGATREGGLFFETNFSLKKMRIYPSVSITTGEGQNFFTPQTNTGFKYGGRLDIMPLGDFIRNNAFIAHDIYREPKAKIAIGVAASLNLKAASPIGSDNPNITGIYDKFGKADFANYRKIVVDFMFKQKGFSLVGEYANGTVTGKELFTNIAATTKFTEQTASTVYNLGSAINIQASYVFKSGWALDVRQSMITPEFDLQGSRMSKQNWLTFGINKYIKNNALRLGLNSTIIDDQTPTIKTKRWTNNLALQIIL